MRDCSSSFQALDVDSQGPGREGGSVDQFVGGMNRQGEPECVGKQLQCSHKHTSTRVANRRFKGRASYNIARWK